MKDNNLPIDDNINNRENEEEEEFYIKKKEDDVYSSDEESESSEDNEEDIINNNDKSSSNGDNSGDSNDDSEFKKNKSVNKEININNKSKKVKSKLKQGDNKNKKHKNNINIFYLHNSNIKSITPEKNIEKFINIKLDKINPLLHLKFQNIEYNEKNYVEDIDLKQYKFSNENKDYSKIFINKNKKVKLFVNDKNNLQGFKIEKNFNYDDYLKSKDINVLKGFHNIEEGDFLNYVHTDLNDRINFILELRKRKLNLILHGNKK